MAKIFEMHSFSKGKRARASYSSDRGNLLPIKIPNELTGPSRPGSSTGVSINNGARLLLMSGLLFGLYVSFIVKKSAVANPKKDEHLQTRATPPPFLPLSKASTIIPADTLRVESSIVPTQTPNAVPHSPAALAPRYSPMRYEATRKKVFGGCTGQLELTGSRLFFRCPNQVELIFPIAAIAKAHKDGVVLKSGEKYHFMIANHTQGQVEAIFISWLDRVQQFPQPERLTSRR